MAEQPVELTAKQELAIGGIILTVALVAQGVVAYSNIGYVSHYMGLTMLVTYLVASVAALTLPYVRHLIGETRHTKATGIFTSLFIAWITVEETLHASHAWAAPQGATQVLASVGFSADGAKGATILALVAISYVLLELLGHFLHIGFSVTHGAHAKLRGAAKTEAE